MPWFPPNLSRVYFLFTTVIMFCFGSPNAWGQEAQKATVAQQPAFSSKQIIFFEQQVRPILRAKCYECHAGDDIKGDLNLASRAGVLAGGESGDIVELGSPDESPLIDAINYETVEMPPEGQLSAKEIAVLTRWVKQGLPWTPGAAEDTPLPKKSAAPVVNDESRSFWSFQKVMRPEIPEHSDTDWGSSPIDSFVLARLKKAGLTPAKSADKVSLIRRAYYDLTGLPPLQQEVATFLADKSPKAFERVVDHLLASPHYGERWGRHWLDLVRYAETNSYERDSAKPFVWRYRDYVIDSFNNDKPYDRFVMEQLAGDELANGGNEGLIGTGFYRLGIWDDEPSDREQAFYDDLDGILTTTGQVFLGLTVNCARCHDHKLDPFPQADYYRLLAFFSGIDRKISTTRPIATAAEMAEQKEKIAAHQAKVDANNKSIKAFEEPIRKDFIPVEHEEFKHQRNQIALVKKRVGTVITQEQFEQYEALFKLRKDQKLFHPKALDQALCVTEIGKTPREMFVLQRGSPKAPGDKVAPGFPSVLSPAEPEITPPAEGNTSGRRLALARWIADEDNPLTARVIVNRIWQFHFGRGIVRSPNNFGFQGTLPTHPQLLDYLASELTAGDWRLKSLHKAIMLSSTYQMSSQGSAEALTKDPTNNLMWRFDMRRLEAEEVRDSILAVSGNLNKEMGGPSIYSLIPKEVLAGQSRPGAGWGKSSPEQQARRSVYIHIKRSLVTPILASFDVADADTTCPVRFATTQPTQALEMLNGPFLTKQAAKFAEFAVQKSPDNLPGQLALVLSRVMQRQPSDEQLARGMTLVDSLKKKHGVSDSRALEYFCLLALNLNEFIYLD